MKHQVEQQPVSTQNAAVLRVLKDHNWHTKHELEGFGGGQRIAARIWDLKQQGKDIDGQWYDYNKRIYMYRLKGEK